MPIENILACQGPEGGSPQTVPLFFSLVILVVLVVSTLSCSKRFVHKRDPETMHQVWSLSISGLNQASVILRNPSELRFSTNGGQTWQIIPSTAFGDAFECATMIDGKRGWAVNRQGYVFTTDSSGASWTKISELKDFTCATQIEFVNEREGWLRECLSIWRTRDGGITWRETLSTVTPGVLGQPSGMFPFDADTLASSGTGGQVYLTKDGGETWRIQAPLLGDNIDFSDVWFVDEMHGWLTGQVLVEGGSLRPLLFQTSDGGNSWKQIPVETDILPSSVCFVADEGWLAGSRRLVNGESVRLEGVLLHTTDGGNHWKRVQLGPDEPFLTNIRFADKEHGWLVGRDSLYRTEDSGKTWMRVLSLPPPAAT